MPINHNRPAASLHLIDESTGLPGRRVSGAFTFGPGLHEVDIASPAIPLILQVDVKRPAMPLGILPPLTPETIGAALRGHLWPGQAADNRPPHCRACLILAPSEVHQPHQVTTLPRPAMARARDVSLTPDVLQTVRIHLDARRPPAPELAGAMQTARYVSQGDLAAALDLPLDTSPAALRRRMTLLVQWAEQQPERYGKALSRAQALMAAHPQLPGLQALFSRLTRGSTWQPVTAVQSSAGLRYVTVTGWRPESPAARVRKALLAPLSPDEQVLSGFGAVLVSMRNLQPTALHVTLTADDIAYFPPAPMTVRYQIDDHPLQRLALTPDRSQQTLHLAIPVGRHTLRFSIDSPLVNQVLRLRIVETRQATPQPLVRSIERAYHIATHDEPVRLLVAGPAWLRIDEWRQGETVTRYQAVAQGWQTIDITPHAGQPEALFRFHQRVAAPISDTPRPRPAHVTPDLLPEPWLRLPLPQVSPYVELRDAYALGKQEDGTWTFSSAWVSRRNVQEDTGADGAERFVELSATHRYAAPYWRLHTETALLGRAPEDGGPVLGLQERLLYRPARFPLSLGLRVKGFVQLPLQGTDLEASGTVRGTVWQRWTLGPKATHRPAISVFGRLLSLNALSADDSGRVDQDVFTPFKSDHRAGIDVADTLTHRPWLDTLWSGQLALASNEDFNLAQPDRLHVRLQWNQLLGALQVRTGYRFSRFFADDDRRAGRNRHTLTIETRWEHWRPSQQRFEVHARLQQDLISGDIDFLLGVSWHTSAGRGYRDFRPGAVHFRDLRVHRLPSQRNNRLDYAETN